MKINFVFAGLNLNTIIQRKKRQKNVLWTMLAKTKGIKYFNGETWMLFDHYYQNFWLRV